MLFRIFYLLGRRLALNLDNFFIAKCVPKMVRVTSKIAKNTENHPWRPNRAFHRGHTEAQKCSSSYSTFWERVWPSIQTTFYCKMCPEHRRAPRRESRKTLKIVRGGQTVRFTGGILKRKVAFQDILPTRKVSRPQSRQLFYCKMRPENGVLRVKNREKH